MTAGSRRRALVAAALSASLIGTSCTKVPREAGAIDGRLGVQVDATAAEAARSMSAPFTLRGDERTGTFELSTPIGTMLARAQWLPGEATLVTVDGTRRFGSLDDLAHDMLGERLPMAALMAWLRGRAWDGAPAVAVTSPVGFEQLGWRIDLSRHDEGFVVSTRPGPPRVTVRARVETAS